MSVNLGSAYGSIELKTDGVTKGARAAATALRDFESQTAGTGRNLDQLAAAGTKAGSQVAQGAQQATQRMRDLGASSADIAGSFDKLAGAAGILGGTLAAGLGVASKKAAELQTAVTRISTIAPEIDVSKVSAQLSAMSTRVAQTSTQFAASLNNIFSSIETNQADALRLTEQFGKGAVAATTDAETFGTALLGVLNAYGLSVDQATHLSDVFFNTINKGVITGDQLAHGLGQVTQQAKLAGVSFDELGALIAGITREGGTAETNITNLQNALNKIVTKDVQDGLRELGIATSNADGSFRSLIPVLGDLKTKLDSLSAGDRTRVLQDLFPDTQARAGIATLLSQLDTITAVLADNANAAGVADAAYAKMGNTAEAKAAILKNTLLATLTDMGTIALPGLVGAAEHLRGLVEAFNGLPEEAKSSIVTVTELSAAFLLLGSGAIKVVSTTVEVVGALKTATVAIRAATVATAQWAITSESGALAIGRLGTAASTAFAAFAAAEGIARIGTGEGLIPLIKSLAEYGDILHKGREEAQAFYDQHKRDVPAFSDEIAKAEARLATLTDAQQKFNNPQTAGEFANTLKEMFTFTQDRRELDINNLIKQIEELKRLQLIAQRIQNGFKVDDQGKVIPGGAWKNKEEMIAGFNEAATANDVLSEAQIRQRAATQGQISTQQQAKNAVAATGEAAGLTAIGMDELSAAYFHNRDAAIALAAAQGATDSRTAHTQELIAALAGEQAAYQKIQQATGPLTTALDQINQKRAAGLPLTAQEAALLQQIPGYLGEAQTAYSALTEQQAQTAINAINAQGGVNGMGSAFAGSATQASGLAGELNRLQGSVLALESAIGALGTENGKLSAEYSILQQRADVLVAKQKEQGKLSAEDAAELATLQQAMKILGDQMGVNAAKQREYVLSLVTGKEAIKKVAGEIASAVEAFKNIAPSPTAADRLIGLTDGFGNVVTAAGNATTAIQGVTTAADTIPATKTIDIRVTGLGPAGNVADGLKGLTEFGPGEGLGAPVALRVDNTAALVSIDQARNALENLPAALPNPIPVVVDPQPAIGAAGLVRGALAAVSDPVAGPIAITTDPSNALLGAGLVQGALAALPKETILTITAVDHASGPINDIRNAVSAVPSSFTVTASVDTTGAIAAITNLRGYMPSSPSKLGPFQKLPNWAAVYETLQPASDEAVATTRSTVRSMADAIDTGLTEAQQAAAKQSAELVSSIASAVTSASAALTALRTLRGPTAEGIVAFRDTTRTVVDAVAAVAADSNAQAVAAAAEYSDSAGKIVSFVKTATDALTGLRSFVRPTDEAVNSFRDVAQYLVNVFAQVTADGELAAVQDAALYADGAEQIFQLVKTATDALTGLRAFQRPTDQAVNSFRDVAQYLVNVMAQVAADGELGPVQDAADWAEGAGKIVAFVSAGAEALTKLRDFERPTDQAVRSFRDVAQYTINLLAQVAADSEQDAVANAGRYADSAAKVLGLLKSGAEGLTALRDFQRPSDQAVSEFAGATARVVAAIAAASSSMDADGIAHAAAYADAAAKVLGLLSSGVTAFASLTSGQVRYPDDGNLRSFAEATARTVLAIATAAGTIDSRAVAAAAQYAEGAGKVVALIGTGVKGFQDLSTFVAPSAQQIAQFKAVVSATVIQLAQAATEIDQQGLAAAAKYGESGGKAIALVGQTIAAFANMKDFVAPSKEGIDSLVSVTNYAVGQLANIARSYSPEALAQLGNFGDAAGRGLGAIRAALDAGKGLGEDHVKPADAIGGALTEFQAGLNPLRQLALVSQEYLTLGNQIGANLAQAYAAIGLSVPGANGGLAGQLPTTTQTVVLHRYEPQTIDLRFLGENGQWIVRSLTLDHGALAATTNLIAGELAAGLTDAAGAAA